MSETKTYPLVMVVWTDTISKSGWMGEESIDQWMQENTWLVHSVGYLVRETPEFLVLAPSWAKDEKQCLNLTKIPRAWAKVYPIEGEIDV